MDGFMSKHRRSGLAKGASAPVHASMNRSSHTGPGAVRSGMEEGPAPILRRLSTAAGFDDADAVHLPHRVQRLGPPSDTAVHQAAREGVQTPSGSLPFGGQIQAAFGRHDIGRIQAHQGSEATRSATAMGARAYATGEHVVFAGNPDLRTAAHEAAHVLQQRGGVQLAGGVGMEGDRYEQHADAVANRVIAGQSAEDLLDQYRSGKAGAPPGTMMMSGNVAIQRVQIQVPGGLQFFFNRAEAIDTQQKTESELLQIYENLTALSERANQLSENPEAFQNLIQEVSTPLLDAIVTGDFKTEVKRVPEVEIPERISVRMGESTKQEVKEESKEEAQSSRVQVRNPHEGRAKKLRGNFGTTVHEQMHWKPTDAKPHHGVWTLKLKEAKNRVSLALNSIYNGDEYLVDSKSGSGGGTWRYLVNMGETIGFLSGSTVSGKPPATHLEVILDKKGNTVSAFPSDPSVF